MTSGVIIILAALVPLLVQLIQFRLSAKQQIKELNEISDKAVASGDTMVLNRIIHDELQN